MQVSPKGILALSFEYDDLGGVVTIREYLLAILKAVWNEGEGFSGKRPFGNSGWEWDLAVPLIKYGVIKGTIDEWGSPSGFDDDEYNRIILECIDAL